MTDTTDTDTGDIETGDTTTGDTGQPVTADRIVDMHGDEHADHGWPDSKYIWLAVILAIVTAAEVYAHSVDWLGPAFVPAMITMMVVKFLAVVLFFMHLRFDSAIFSWLFYSGLLLAVGVYIGFLLMNRFFSP
ncbi:MAG: cytochrome C oxidase subunit IV family protein [Ilumatobacteraceae bacterium]